MLLLYLLHTVRLNDNHIKVEGMEDWDLWIRCLDYGYWGYTIPEFLYWYRSSPPGKWRSISDPARFSEFKANLKEKYPTAYSNKVPQIPIDAPSLSKVAVELPFTNNLTKTNPRILLISTNAAIGGADQFNYNLVKGNNALLTVVTMVKA
jgi:hypothetical protein